MNHATHSAATIDSPAPDISIVIPLYNEEENVADVYSELKGVLDAIGKPYEIIMVDDGSRDKTYSIAAELANQDTNLVVLRFKFNAGQTAAMQAGFDYSRGKVIIPMDGDGQNDPASIPELLAKIDEGYDVVSGWRKNRQDTFISRKLPSKIANALISKATGVKLHDYGCSMKAYRSESLEGVKLYGEMHRFIPVYAAWNGANITEHPVKHRARLKGKSKYGISRTFKVMLDLITIQFLGGYRTKPIYFFGKLGAAALIVAFIIGSLVLGLKLYDPARWSIVENPLTMATVLCLILGIQFISLGVIAELQMRTFYESSRRPPYVVAKAHNARIIHRSGHHDDR